MTLKGGGGMWTMTQQMCLESGDGSGTIRSWRQRVPDSRCRDAECFGLEVDPCRRLIEQ